MDIKKENYNKSYVNFFELIGDNEVALSKAFAFVLANDYDVLKEFLQELDISWKKEDDRIKALSIKIEVAKNDGRTDIEIKEEGKFHVIIECKVGINKVEGQKTQYNKRFDNTTEKNILCFITAEKIVEPIIEKGIVVSLSWLNIVDMLNKKAFSKIVNVLLNFIIGSYKMNTLKEILVQDLKKSIGIKRFLDCYSYVREETSGIPLYFAPYFTKKGVQDYKSITKTEGISEGISYISKVLGVLTLEYGKIKEDWKHIEDKLNKFAEGIENRENLVKKWEKGLKDCNEKLEEDIPKTKNQTYYFLSKPIELKKPLLKDNNKNSNGWIGPQIPKNRNIKFDIFLKKIIETI